MIDLKKAQLLFNISTADWINPEEMANQYSLNFKMRDGLILRGYLTLPGPTDGGPYPTVALTHGGPWARDYWGFDREVQMLASQGYAVLQLNYRGSSGYGLEISQKYSGDFKDMVLDVADATNQIVEKELGRQRPPRHHGHQLWRLCCRSRTSLRTRPLPMLHFLRRRL